MAQLQTLTVPGDFVSQVKQDANHADLFLIGSLLLNGFCFYVLVHRCGGAAEFSNCSPKAWRR